MTEDAKNNVPSYEKKFYPESHWRKESNQEMDPNPDPLVRGTGPRILIRTKMSRIPNTGWMFDFIRDLPIWAGRILALILPDRQLRRRNNGRFAQ